MSLHKGSVKDSGHMIFIVL